MHAFMKPSVCMFGFFRAHTTLFHYTNAYFLFIYLSILHAHGQRERYPTVSAAADRYCGRRRSGSSEHLASTNKLCAGGWSSSRQRPTYALDHLGRLSTNLPGQARRIREWFIRLIFDRIEPDAYTAAVTSSPRRPVRLVEILMTSAGKHWPYSFVSCNPVLSRAFSISSRRRRSLRVTFVMDASQCWNSGWYNTCICTAAAVINPLWDFPAP